MATLEQVEKTIAELRSLLTNATPGKWRATVDRDENAGGGVVWITEDDNPYCMLADCRPGGVGNARLIAAMHEALPVLLDVAEAAFRCANETSVAGAGDRWRDVLEAIARLR